MRFGTPVQITAGSVVSVTVSCEPGERAAAGGTSPPSGLSFDDFRVVYSTPMTGQSNSDDGDVPNGWNVRVRNEGVTTGTAVPRVVCVSP